ncbi:DUF1634 domain-containing protein [Scandinavium sp. TWS1a]|uniref:DUF1634 domain-containing protein n=1 Tax=Scandinavium tedordense TaxID=2926521 RepID=UPI002165B303|nr:DUF1634 domain-containing protein [Scandinavium tedordense]MCS2168867.1 DUF1634 domain-containing protein [Scandinavium tedordense]
MKPTIENRKPQEPLLAVLLEYGTWLACTLIAAGMIITALEPSVALFPLLSGYRLVKAGVAVFILLPVTRVAMMAIFFLRDRDYLYVAITVCVLTIIAAGMIIEH